MSLLQEYKTYLQNNPEGYWFKRKLYGWGWIPATRLGWVVFVGYLLFVVGLSVISEGMVSDAQAVSHVVLPVLLATVVLLLIMYRTGEPLKWQWGKNDGK